jgi:hypothetical protein
VDGHGDFYSRRMELKTGTTRIALGIIANVVVGFLVLRGLLIAAFGPLTGADALSQLGNLVGLMVLTVLLFASIRLLLRGLNERRIYLATVTTRTQAEAVAVES